MTLRTLRLGDARSIQRYCNDRAVSKWINAIPHPYRLKDAVKFIKECAVKWNKGTDYIYVIEYEGNVVGTIGLHGGDAPEAQRVEAA